MIRLLGLTEPPPPSPDQRRYEFPVDMTAEHYEELGTQMTVWVALLNYAAYQKTLVDGDKKDISGTIKRKIEDHLVAERSSARTVTEKRAVALSRSEVRSLINELDVADKVSKLLGTLAENYDRNYGAISREISRRTSTAVQQG